MDQSPISSTSALANNRIALRMVGVSLLLAIGLIATLVLCLWWAVNRIDAQSLRNERQALDVALAQEMDQIDIEQDGSAEWDDAVLRVRAADQPWIAENLVEWMSSFFGHDRVYVIAPDGKVLRAASAGAYAGTTLAPIDVGTVLPRLTSLRQKMADASAGLDDSTPAITSMSVIEAERLPSGEFAILAIRPIVPSTEQVTQAPGTEFMMASVKLIDQEMLDDIAARLGISDLQRVPYPDSAASLTLTNADNRLVGYLGWTPQNPARGLLMESAPALIAMVLSGMGALVILLTWVRTTSFKLEKSRAQTTYFALHDPLTGAANRILFDRKLRDAIGYQYLAKAQVLLVAIDIDHFKEINDTLGHAAGDRLLSEVAKRLLFELPEEATLGRLGGDEFAIVQPGVISQGQALWICQRLLGALQKPFQFDDSAAAVTFSLGIALEDGMATPPAEMLRRADLALYAAKTAGRNRLMLYDPGMDQSRRDKRALEIDLRNALLTQTGLYVVFQPIFAARSGEIAGAEALVRWHHPERGAMAPDQFIGLAEETGLIDQLGLWVLQQACAAAVAVDLPQVAVNVSPVQFRDEALADKILAVAGQAGLPAYRLEIEITEGVLLQNSPAVQKTLARLREAGVKVALDDFGTGYSSIGYLRSYAIDKLKIDRSFTRLVSEDRATARIVRSITEMAEALGMNVTAEGVEEEDQRRTLVKLGCSLLQGYLLSRPLPLESLSTLLLEHQSNSLVRLFAQE